MITLFAAFAVGVLIGIAGTLQWALRVREGTRERKISRVLMEDGTWWSAADYVYRRK